MPAGNYSLCLVINLVPYMYSHRADVAFFVVPVLNTLLSSELVFTGLPTPVAPVFLTTHAHLYPTVFVVDIFH